MTSDAMDLTAAVYARFTAVNGKHPMTAADDAYVTKHFIALADLCSAHGEAPDAVRGRMLAGELPLPGYIRSDGTEMVPPDYFDLADQAGGIAALPGWFQGHWSDDRQAAEEWRAYLNGLYVCLHAVTPLTIQRKDELTVAIKHALADPEPDSAGWLSRLHRLVDELDELMLEFAHYDRLRAGGPVSRDIYIDDVRARYPRPE